MNSVVAVVELLAIELPDIRRDGCIIPDPDVLRLLIIIAPDDRMLPAPEVPIP